MRESGIIDKLTNYRFASFFLLATIYIVALLIFNYVKHLGSFSYVFQYLIGVAGSLTVILTSVAISGVHFSANQLLFTIGYYSMSIYSFHTLFESSVRILFFNILGDFNVPFIIVGIAAISCGLFFPLLLEKFLLRKNEFTKYIYSGLSREIRNKKTVLNQ
jgi:hypothetical protein